MYKFPNTLLTKYNENYFADLHFHWRSCADQSMIDKFIEVGESLVQQEAKIGGPVDSSINAKVRVSTLSWIRYNEQSKEVYDFLVDKIDRVNFWHFGMTLNGMEDIQYTRYPVGGHYRFHHDIILKKENHMRKLSIVLALTPAEEYEGGELLLMPHGENPLRLKLGLGDLIAFPSWVPHKVNPVTSGNRITAVTWIYGPKFV